MGWRVRAAAHVEELAGDTGTSTGLVKLETVQGTGASQGATEGGGGAAMGQSPWPG